MTSLSWCWAGAISGSGDPADGFAGRAWCQVPGVQVSRGCWLQSGLSPSVLGLPFWASSRGSGGLSFPCFQIPSSSFLRKQSRLHGLWVKGQDVLLPGQLLTPQGRNFLFLFFWLMVIVHHPLHREKAWNQNQTLGSGRLMWIKTKSLLWQVIGYGEYWLSCSFLPTDVN
jgi:hypothetical protein